MGHELAVVIDRAGTAGVLTVRQNLMGTPVEAAVRALSAEDADLVVDPRTEPVCTEPECCRHRGALWGAMAALEDVGQRIDGALEAARQRQAWTNELMRLLGEFCVEYGTPALMARATAKQRELMAQARLVAGAAERRASTTTESTGGESDADKGVQ
jgi:hypothetical protein